MPYAVLFPGQGAAAPAAGRPWKDHPAWALVDEAEVVLDRPLAHLLLTADAAELSRTEPSQLAVFLTSLVAWDALVPSLREPPVAFAGHSLGQITALVASGAVDRVDGFCFAAERARLSQVSADSRPGQMAALHGADIEAATRLCDAVADVWIANDNAPGQIVVAGTTAGMTQAAERAAELGIKSMRKLDVGHAFHTPLLADAADGLRPLLDTVEFHPPTAPIVANTDATAHTDPSDWPEQLTRHLVEPVRWHACQEVLAAGADTFLEIGPGRVLAGLAKRTVPDVAVHNLSHPDDLQALTRAGALMEVCR